MNRICNCSKSESLTKKLLKTMWLSVWLNQDAHWTDPKGCLLIATGTLKWRTLEDCTGRSSAHKQLTLAHQTHVCWWERQFSLCLFLLPTWKTTFLFLYTLWVMPPQYRLTKMRVQLLSCLTAGWLVPEAHCKITLLATGQEQNIFSYKIEKSLGLCDRFLFSQFVNSLL